MAENEVRNYLLVVRKNNNSFQSVEWNLTKFYQGENLHTLDGIDKFTGKTSRLELLEELLELNILSPTDTFQGYSIIFQTPNGRTRELKEGVIFNEDTAVLSEDELIDFIIENQDNKEILNEIYNVCNFKDKDEKVLEFKFIVKNLDLFKARGENGVIGALSLFKKISYEKKRTIILKVVDTILPRINKKLQYSQVA